MEYTVLPDDYYLPSNADAEISIIPYSSTVPVIKGKSILKKNMISLIQKGEKIIHYTGKVIAVHPSRIVLLAAGNYLATQRLPETGQLSSILIFFDNSILDAFLEQQPKLTASNHTTEDASPYVLFEKDAYLNHYISSLQMLFDRGIVLTDQIKKLKVNELFFYLYSTQLQPFLSFSRVPVEPAGNFELMKVMQANISSSLTLSELAFLCNMSLSTFKRRFEQVYHTAPNKWLLERKMELAADLLRRKKNKPSEIYLEIGYENHSSFTKAFRRIHGVSPKEYQDHF